MWSHDSAPPLPDHVPENHTGRPGDHSGKPQGHSGPPEDIYVGCVHVDLSTLALGLPQISGWYNISDFGGETQGQLKV